MKKSPCHHDNNNNNNKHGDGGGDCHHELLQKETKANAECKCSVMSLNTSPHVDRDIYSLEFFISHSSSSSLAVPCVGLS